MWYPLKKKGKMDIVGGTLVIQKNYLETYYINITLFFIINKYILTLQLKFKSKKKMIIIII